jgi:predicted methyltransferase
LRPGFEPGALRFALREKAKRQSAARIRCTLLQSTEIKGEDMKHLLIGAAALFLFACSGQDEGKSEATEAAPAGPDVVAVRLAEQSAEERLDAVLARQDEETKARYQYRHPKETLKFFGVEPGMTVVDTLPGYVWYSGILADYLGADGKVIGADYSLPMWRLFGGFASEEWLADRENWRTTYIERMAEAANADRAPADAFVYGSLPESMYGVADVVLVIRATHHFNRFEEEGGYFTAALADIRNVLKPGGIVGLVQHRAPAENSDAWADGSNGYLKQDQVIAFFEANGFELVEASEINANPNDRPSEEEFVWRLPPSLNGAENDEERKAAMLAIGESDRMTLKFRKL